MEIVQIEITNACARRCSNCSRFCGHHPKPFFMDFDFFAKAVESMRGFRHCVGIMGGEPTLHPEFARFVRHFRDNFPESRPHHAFTGPSDNFIRDIEDNNLRLKRDVIRGLWSSLGPGYRKHFELIQDSFGYQCLNDHLNPSQHAAVLVTRKELGIPDEEWYPLRDACWVQNLWSASITPKGAFFCEVAASMDLLLDGPGGWPVEPGWWEREPGDFGDQLQWCELCSAALAMPKRDAREEIDDVSPWWRDRLLALGSPKAGAGGLSLFDPGKYRSADYQVNHELRPYLSDTYQRLSRDNRMIYPERVATILMTSGDATSAAGGEFDFVVPERATLADIAALSPGERGAWVLLCRTAPPKDLARRLTERIFNPGCLYGGDGWHFFNLHAEALAGGGEAANVAALYPSEKTVTVEWQKMPENVNASTVERPPA